eukprot:TRINITY_DN9375_c0_g1_i1.p1 TRINITY_DN9375_c0_g1~~TRINITY_DN9375_c0_g1_i1.p1  ORF type:complete len:185 (-),score=26.24 TRINITY_DN9375_c0_g1_i1:82-636(-)
MGSVCSFSQDSKESSERSPLLKNEPKSQQQLQQPPPIFSNAAPISIEYEPRSHQASSSYQPRTEVERCKKIVREIGKNLIDVSTGRNTPLQHKDIRERQAFYRNHVNRFNLKNDADKAFRLPTPSSTITDNEVKSVLEAPLKVSDWDIDMISKAPSVISSALTQLHVKDVGKWIVNFEDDDIGD